MDITSISSVQGLGSLKNGIVNGSESATKNRNQAFETMFQSALDMIKGTQAYTDQAEQAAMDYAMGVTNSTHDLQIAQTKASISLQYTVAVRNAVLDAYKEIMQLQF
ncbi:MAG TPA: flagellar hook-basal body complex protein FliE [Lachnoclostridium phytofermentans]|uniref:Flagellar hook-basal body complex protein FliE n=1 Tax=Lachnoclostridium phytofermentans TaxID=66219 RepID=A0A3D2X896_9FIRM|nr:flagellar hook-basal body complex protein FliE [Lachnoclostridium sp.]HCL03342.1 flagellar hook-basal body complex protein FliE [Lachnoclostridium phytofermentans]